jgi:hypothetical protein
MAASDTRKIASALTDLNLAVTITGPLARPRVVVDPKQTLQSLSASLGQIGKTHLAGVAGDALKRVGHGTGEVGSGVIKSTGHLFKSVENLATGDAKAAGGQLIEGAGELLKGMGDAVTEDPNGGLLEGLLGNGRKKSKDANDTDATDPNESKGPLEELFGG